MQHQSLRSQFSALKHVDGYAEMNIDNGYEIVPAVHPDWKKAERRILFVLESVDSADIRGGQLFSSSSGKRNEEQNLMIATFPNVMEQAWKLYQEYLGNNSLADTPAHPDFCIAVVNFNAWHSFGSLSRPLCPFPLLPGGPLYPSQ